MRIGIVAGEASGDLLGAGLIKSLQARVPGLQCEGVAGPLMQAAGCEVIADSEVLAVMGLIEPIREIPRLIRLRRMLLSRWREDPPDVVVGIDSPDFNLGLEIKLRQSDIATVHYVSPSVWAWRQGRIRKIRKAVDKVLCLLPFEKNFMTIMTLQQILLAIRWPSELPRTRISKRHVRRWVWLADPWLPSCPAVEKVKWHAWARCLQKRANSS